MAKCLIVADDLTGANASGILLRKIGLNTLTLINYNENIVNNNKLFDAITVPTYSRSLEQHEAYEKVYKVSKSVYSKETVLMNKRIDSTLRGNIGGEIDGMLDALTQDYMALVVPVFPKSGRICLGGYLLVNGEMLHNTSVGKDPKAPVTTSKVVDIVSSQSKYKIAHMDISVVQQGKEKIAETIKDYGNQGIKILVIDGVTDDDLNLIGEGAVYSQVPFITVCPGPFTASVAKILFNKIKIKKKKEEKILLTVGSVTDLTKKQLMKLREMEKLYIHSIDTMDLIHGKKDFLEKLINTVMEESRQYINICVTTTFFDKAYKIDLNKIATKMGLSIESVSNKINDALGYITRELIERIGNVKGVYTSGGDVTIAVCNALKASAVDLKKEIIPLAVGGEVIGGPHTGLKIVTKGGLIGDEFGMVKCLEYLK